MQYETQECRKDGNQDPYRYHLPEYRLIESALDPVLHAAYRKYRKCRKLHVRRRKPQGARYDDKCRRYKRYDRRRYIAYGHYVFGDSIYHLSAECPCAEREERRCQGKPDDGIYGKRPDERRDYARDVIRAHAEGRE